MEEVRKTLTKQEQALLADLWEDLERIKALRKALLQRQFHLSVTTMASEVEWEQFLENRGEIKGSKWAIDFLKHNHKKHEEARTKAQAQNVE